MSRIIARVTVVDDSMPVLEIDMRDERERLEILSALAQAAIATADDAGDSRIDITRGPIG